jgi:hypothetical protein
MAGEAVPCIQVFNRPLSSEMGTGATFAAGSPRQGLGFSPVPDYPLR